MADATGNTQERPAIRASRRSAAPVRANYEDNTSTRGKKTKGKRKRPPQRASSGNRRPPSNGRRAKAGAHSSGSKPRRDNRRRGVPVVLTLVLVAIGIVAAVFVTRAVLVPQIEKAQQQTAEARSQVSTLTQQLANATAKKESSSSSTKSDDKDSSSSSSSSKSSSEATTESGVDSAWTKSGKFTSGDAVLDGEVKAFCDSKADSSMDRDTALFNVYTGIAWSDYVERDAAQHPSGKNWRLDFARMYYENGCSGNCYEFASFLSYCLQYMGYDDATAEGVLIEQQSGGWGDHGIVFLTSDDGVKSICDTARGTDGWMLPETAYNMQVQDFENA